MWFIQYIKSLDTWPPSLYTYDETQDKRLSTEQCVFLDWLIGSGFLWTTRLCSGHGYIWRHQQQPYIWTAVTAVTAAMVTKEKKEGDDTCCSEDMQAVCLISSRWSGGCTMTNTGLTNALWRQGRCCYCMLKELAEQRALTESCTFFVCHRSVFHNVKYKCTAYA